MVDVNVLQKVDGVGLKDWSCGMCHILRSQRWWWMWLWDDGLRSWRISLIRSGVESNSHYISQSVNMSELGSVRVSFAGWFAHDRSLRRINAMTAGSVDVITEALSESALVITPTMRYSMNWSFIGIECYYHCLSMISILRNSILPDQVSSPILTVIHSDWICPRIPLVAYWSQVDSHMID